LTRGSSDVAWRRYYYPIFDRTRTVGFYVYSELPPDDFHKIFGPDEARFTGVWEETPGDIRRQDAMSHAREFEIAGMKPRLTTQGDSVADILHRYPLRTDRRLALRTDIWKTGKITMLAGTFVFFAVGLGMVWAALRRRIHPV
jgi:hypothetical protein